MQRTLTVPGRYACLEQICKFVAEAAAEAGMSQNESARCQLAVDEACTNIIEHGYEGENRGDIQVICEPRSGELTITIRDSAKKFDSASVPPPRLDVPLDERQAGGLGLHLMRQVMEVVEFSYAGGGNTLRLIKRKEQ